MSFQYFVMQMWRFIKISKKNSGTQNIGQNTCLWDIHGWYIQYNIFLLYQKVVHLMDRQLFRNVWEKSCFWSCLYAYTIWVLMSSWVLVPMETSHTTLEFMLFFIRLCFFPSLHCFRLQFVDAGILEFGMVAQIADFCLKC